jgi:hypothetical protein
LYFNKASSVEIVGALAGSLSLFGTRGHSWESLKQFDAYLFLYAFKLFH